MEINKEVFEKLIQAQSPDEVIFYGLENGLDISTDMAVRLFEMYQSKSFTLDELQSMEANSWCRKGRHYSSDEPHYLIVSALNSCPMFSSSSASTESVCSDCDHSTRKGFVIYCKKRKYNDDEYNK